VWFLGVDANLVRLIELAVQQAPDEATRARLLARLARELLGDASAAARRRLLASQAVELARQVGDPKVLAETLDARLGAVWDPEGAEQRLETGAEIIGLAREAGDLARERTGLFWRFVALMELGRVAEAESTLAAFERQAELAGDVEGKLMAKARRASLAILRGRFDDAAPMVDEVLEEGRRIRLPDADHVAATLHSMIMKERGGDMAVAVAGVDDLRQAAQHAEASLELERVLPRVLAGTGPRSWRRPAGDVAAAARTRWHWRNRSGRSPPWRIAWPPSRRPSILGVTPAIWNGPRRPGSGLVP
jgi:hypothetical protein